MADLIVNILEAVNSHISRSNRANKNKAVEIGNDILQLSRSVIKHHTLPEERRHKYCLPQPLRMLSREVPRWNVIICRRMRASPCLRHPWNIKIKRNMPFELFESLKAHVLLDHPERLSRSTRCVEELAITEDDDLKAILLTLSNKFKTRLLEESTLWRTHTTGGYSTVVVSISRPALFKYSKSQEVLSISLFYGYWNRIGVPQHTFNHH